MLSDDATTRLFRIPSEPDPRWSIPPLTLGRAAQAAVTRPSEHLPGGARLGEHMVAEPRGRDGHFELHVVTHAERGSLHMARVLRREHAELAPAILTAARQIQQNPQRNLRAVLETGWTDEPTPRAFIVHERLVGRSLASLANARSGIEWPLVVAIGIQCAEALGTLHRVGLAHTQLRPDSAALMHIAGDQFRVVLGGLEHAQAITPDACAAEEPRVHDDLYALGRMLAALAAGSATPATPVPEMLTCLLARMTDPRPAIRPATASELHDQLSAVYHHVDPDLSSVRMLGEAFHRITSDDFEVSIEVDELPPRPQPVVKRPRPPSRWPSALLIAIVAVVSFTAGASLPERQAPVVAHSLAHGDDLTTVHALRHVPTRPATHTTTVVTLPRHERATRGAIVRTRPTTSPSPPAAIPEPAEPEPEPEPEPELARAASDEPPDSPLLPVPLRGAEPTSDESS